MKNMKPSLNRSFTLIELLVVVAIIAVLVALLLPALQKAREQARKLVDQTNVKGVSTAMLMYADDHVGKTPPIYNQGINTDVWSSDWRISEPANYANGYPVGGAGYLVEKKYTTLEMMFCPLTTHAADETKNYKSNNWCSASYCVTYSRRLTGDQIIGLVTERYEYGLFDWSESFLNHVNMKVDELMTGFSDGSTRLIKDPYRNIRTGDWEEMAPLIRIFWYYCITPSYLNGELPKFNGWWLSHAPGEE